MKADLEFRLVNGRCEAGSGHQWAQVWTCRPNVRYLQLLQYHGKKQLPSVEEGLLDRVADKVEKRERAYIGGIAIYRLCEGVTHARVPRLEKLGAYAIVHSTGQDPLPMVPQKKPITKNGWGSAKVDLPGAGLVEHVIYLPQTPAEADKHSYQSLLVAAAQQPKSGMYVAWSGAEQIVLPSQLMLDAATK
ncbi:MAG TPA: hypothetical protein VFI84_03025 [Candidatus Saccharimonadales bacterium]|nr:hypothetical protein [Candidatus Saccharimonadales bacterium]